MRRVLLVTTLLAALAATVPAAHSGSSIAKAPACANSYLYLAPGVSRRDYRTAVLCLVNGARRAQGLPQLRRSTSLEAVAQQRSDRFVASGTVRRGRSADIGRRFTRRGYRPAAFDEAFSVLSPGASPYAFLSRMTSSRGAPCTQIFDSRFRDAGIGVSSARGVANMLVIELGRRAGTSRPSANARVARTCSHRVPAPLVTGPAVQLVGSPVAAQSTVTVLLKCRARAACTLAAKLTLPAAQAATPFRQVTIAAGATQATVFALDAAAIEAELAGTRPQARLSFTLSDPAQYSDTLSAPLTR